MVTILIEGVLFVALLATVGALFVFGVGRTPAGRWIRQTRNRQRIEHQAALAAATHCPAHGRVREDDLVRLPGGGHLCPACYAELLHDAR